MASNNFADSARAHRSSGAVLKIRISEVRSRNPTAVIAVLEGVTDVGPYEVWIGRIRAEMTMEFIPGTGKSQLLDFRRRMKQDRSGLMRGVYLFVDHDFDGLREQDEGDDIFCTQRYSVENYLVSTVILRSILSDEFRCTAETEHRDNILTLFGRVLCEFNSCMKDANRRIFCGKRLGIGSRPVENRISEYVQISFDEVQSMHDDAKLRELIVFEREPTSQEIEELDNAFDILDAHLHYRGKFLLAFFMTWLSKLADERRRHGQTTFPESASTKISVSSLNLRSLASRAAMPEGLEEVVQNMRSS